MNPKLQKADLCLRVLKKTIDGLDLPEPSAAGYAKYFPEATLRGPDGKVWAAMHSPVLAQSGDTITITHTVTIT